MADSPQDELVKLRTGIDGIDAALIGLMADRFRLTDSVGLLKAAHGLPAVDANREEAQFERIRGLARSSGMDEELAVRLMKQVIHEVVQRHISTARSVRST